MGGERLRLSVSRRAVGFCALLCASAFPLHAKGTPAGTDVINVAQLTWLDGDAPRSVNSNQTTLKVDERIDVAIAWLDGGSVPVAPNDQGRALTFRVVNAGNAPEAFALAGLGTLPGDQWDPAIASLALDTNGNGVFDPGTDQTYRPGADEPMLQADASVIVFVVSNVPGGLADAALGLASLRATAVTGSGSAGTVFSGRGESGTDAIVGATTATATAEGSLIASLAVPQLAKSQLIVDPNGGASALPGALITYTLVASYAGSVPTSAGLIEDPIPVGTSYVPGTLKLNGSALTDSADGDAGEAGTSGVRVAIGSLTAGSSATVTFQVRVNN